MSNIPVEPVLRPTGKADLPLVVGISTRAMFDLEDEHALFKRMGVRAYAEHQRKNEDDPLKPGTGFEVVRRLLNLNTHSGKELIKVVFLSQNSPDLSLRAFNSAQHHKLDIRYGSFTSGRSVAPYLDAWDVDLFLSNETSDVEAATQAGTAAARLSPPPKVAHGDHADEVRIAFDGDAVVFSDESDQIYKSEGLKSFLAHEVENAEVCMTPGPFGNFLSNLSKVRKELMRNDGSSLVRIAIVTARNAPAHERVIKTLRQWGTPADEAHFVGPHEKAKFLAGFGADIFFDDQEKHVTGASALVPSGLVPGPHDPGAPVIPSV